MCSLLCWTRRKMPTRPCLSMEAPPGAQVPLKVAYDLGQIYLLRYMIFGGEWLPKAEAQFTQVTDAYVAAEKNRDEETKTVLQPLAAEAYAGRGTAANWRKDTEGAIALYEQAAGIASPRRQVLHYLAAGDISVKSGQIERGRAYYDKAEEYRPRRGSRWGIGREGHGEEKGVACKPIASGGGHDGHSFHSEDHGGSAAWEWRCWPQACHRAGSSGGPPGSGRRTDMQQRGPVRRRRDGPGQHDHARRGRRSQRRGGCATPAAAHGPRATSWCAIPGPRWAGRSASRCRGLWRATAPWRSRCSSWRRPRRAPTPGIGSWRMPATGRFGPKISVVIVVPDPELGEELPDTLTFMGGGGGGTTKSSCATMPGMPGGSR